jgi:hypothetical protein
MHVHRKYVVRSNLMKSSLGIKEGVAGAMLACVLSGCVSNTPPPAPISKPVSQELRPPKERLAVMGITPSPERLVQFAAQGDGTVVGLLLQTGMSANTSEPVRQVTALHNAAAQGHLRIIQTLIEHGADVNAADWHGNTPLINAAYFGHLDAVKALLEKGANINAISKEGITALTAATYSGNDLVASYLLAQGAASSLPKDGSNAPLAVAQRAKRDAVAASIQQGLGNK